VYQAKGDIANALEDFQQACSLGSRDGCEFLERARLLKRKETFDQRGRRDY
jgi:hypothetical protein